MKKVSKIAAIASVAVASFLPMASAYATDNCVGSSDGCKPPVPQGSNEEGGVLPSEQEQPAPAATTSTEAPSGELPFTGGDVVGLAIIGAGALGLGAVMVRKSKAAKTDA